MQSSLPKSERFRQAMGFAAIGIMPDAVFVAVPLRLRFSRCLRWLETSGSGH
jgi:hypothetical protein